MKPGIHHRLLLLLGSLMLALLAGCATEEVAQGRTGQATDDTAVGSQPGALAADFTLPRLSGGDLTLSSLRGKAVIVDFWDTWCGPCRRAMPHLQQLSETYADDLVVVGVAFGREGAEKVRSYVRDQKLTFEMVLFNQDPALARSYGGLQSIPTTFLIDGDGVIQQKWVGAMDKAVYENAIRQVIEG